MRRLQRVPAEGRLPLLVEYLQEEVSRLLRLDVLPDPETGFAELGMDSLMTVELRNRLDQDLSLETPLTVTALFDYPNINALADSLKNLKEQYIKLEPNATRRKRICQKSGDIG